jgi:hypothetical protein
MIRLQRGEPLDPGVALGDRGRAALAAFDATGVSGAFAPWIAPTLPDVWTVGLIVGASGSGKSLLLADRFGGPSPQPEWDPTRAVADQVDVDLLAAVGLNDVPTWLRPYHVLSTGQRFRADLARLLERPAAVVDEFTSVVSRPVAMSACAALSRWADRNPDRRLVVATCHHDVEEWLRPSWVIDTDDGVLRTERLPARRWSSEPIARLTLF